MDSCSELPDQEARDRFQNELDVNFCVSAGAGVGKTTAIVHRIVQTALRHPERMASLVVVTYGVAAADELKSRARLAILDALADRPLQVREVLQEFSRAFFGTIHSFCLQLIREFGHEAGLSADSLLLDDAGRERMWQQFLHSEAVELSGEQAALMKLVLRFASLDALYEFAGRLDLQEAERALQQVPVVDLPELDCTALLEMTNARAKTLPEEQARLAAWIGEYSTGDSYCPVFVAASGGKPFQEGVAVAMEPLHAWLGRAVLCLAAHWAVAFRDRRIEAGRLTYDDMIHFSNRLLDRPQVAERLRSRNYRVILDEAQDTDATMFDTLMRITSRPGEKWAAPGHFSFVGDDQQAIFSSRASVGHYVQTLKEFVKSGAAEQLSFSVTMRCPVRVVDAANRVFSGRGLEAGCVKFREVIARPGASAGNVLSFPLPVPPPKTGVNPLFEMEADAIADFLAAHGPAGLGVSRWSDVAILGARNSWLRSMKSALLRKGIPVLQLGGGEKLRHQPGATWPAALLHVLLYPDDTFELVGVLREIFGIPDRALIDFTADLDCAMDLFSTHRNCDPDLRAALDVLLQAREHWLNPEADHLYSLVTAVFSGVRLRERLLAAFPLQVSFFEDVLRCAREASVEGAGLPEFTSALMDRLDTEVVENAGGQDAVQLLSCHKSKGLQWPVVIVPGLWRTPGAGPVCYPCITRIEGETHVAAIQGGRSEDVTSALREAANQELLRLLYVAMTRARHCLVLPGVVAPPDSRNSSAFATLAAFQEVDWQPLFAAPQDAPFAFRTEAPGGEAEFVFIASPDAATISGQVPERVLPHALVHDPLVLPEDADVEFSVAVGGVEYGTWWHTAMEQVDWLADAGRIRATLEDLLGGLPESSPDRARARMEVESLLAGDVPERLRKGVLIQMEVPFLHPVSPAEWREGVIDLVVLQADGSLWILDWKTNRCPNGVSGADHHASLVMRYRPQLEAYAGAVEAVTGRRVARMSLFATATGGLLDV